MHGILISAKPPQREPRTNPYLSLVKGGEIQKYELKPGDLITIQELSPEQKFCCGWYDISTHTNYPCPNNSKVDTKYDSCYVCRTKTNFNPAFYNSTQISEEQKIYNQTPHSTYIAYFGRGLTKAGIMADSRGLTRLYEQGAIFYVVIGSYPDAYKARNTELSLIKSSLAESIRKKQKEEILKSQFDTQKELKEFANILNLINPEYTKGIKSNLNIFTFGKNDVPLVKPLKKSEPISGTIKAIFGKYLILENSGRFYGLWVDDLYGKQIEISQELSLIEPEPEQAFLL